MLTSRLSLFPRRLESGVLSRNSPSSDRPVWCELRDDGQELRFHAHSVQIQPAAIQVDECV